MQMINSFWQTAGDLISCVLLVVLTNKKNKERLMIVERGGLLTNSTNWEI
jgi:hypothetical protein